MTTIAEPVGSGISTVGTPRIAVIGGTGALGLGLALRFARAGYKVTIGSRDVERARVAAAEVGPNGVGAAIEDAVRGADIVVLALPYATRADILSRIAPLVVGKIVVDTTVPLRPPAVSRVQLPAAGSAAIEAREAMGAGVHLVSAFQNVAAAHLRDLDHHIDCDVLVTGDDKAARQQVVDLARGIGCRAWHAGPLDNAVAAEALTSLLIFINRTYGINGAGFRITGGSGADHGSASPM